MQAPDINTYIGYVFLACLVVSEILSLIPARYIKTNGILHGTYLLAKALATYATPTSDQRNRLNAFEGVISAAVKEEPLDVLSPTTTAQ